ncbi:MAG: hypothetical protein ACYS0I_03460 [Planctomycetota bacterium]|jgi:hypothetical protein
MLQEKFCQGCYQRRQCQKVYQQLAKVQGPSVVLKVLAAFLLPLIVFIGVLVAFEKILPAVIISEKLQTALSFLMALLATFLTILIIKAVNQHINKNE